MWVWTAGWPEIKSKFRMTDIGTESVDSQVAAKIVHKPNKFPSQ